MRQFIIACTTPTVPSPLVVQFREAFHDAVELGHRYTVATREDDEPEPSKPLEPFRDGTMATRLWSMLVVHWWLQRCVATVILLVCHGVHRGDGRDRIVVEVVTRDVTSGTFLVSGLSRVQCGFSFPVSNAPRQLWRLQLLLTVGFWRLGHPWQDRRPWMAQSPEPHSEQQLQPP